MEILFVFKDTLNPLAKNLTQIGVCYITITPVVNYSNKGYNLLSFGSQFKQKNQQISFQSDPYPCFHSPSFRDINEIFKPCYFTTKTNLHQQTALLAHRCGPRQFYNGSCHNIDQACNTFNPRADWCYTCKNTSIQAIDGKCRPPLPPAAPSLPEHCLEGDSSGCRSCSSPIYEVVDGACALKACPPGSVLDAATGGCIKECSPSQQNIGGVCYKKRAHCLRMAPHLACEKCDTGYGFRRGDCVLSANLQEQP